MRIFLNFFVLLSMLITPFSVSFAQFSSKHKNVANYWIKTYPSHKQKWQWGAAVAMFGLSRYADSLSQIKDKMFKKDIINYVHQYHMHYLNKGIPEIDYPDLNSPTLSALINYQQTRDSKLLINIMSGVDFLRSEKRLKFKDSPGSISHLGHHWFSYFYPASIWVDSMMMYVLPAVLIGDEIKDNSLKSFGLAQYKIYADRLQSENGLFYHAWHYKKKRIIPNSNAAHWLRGNGWVAASLVEALDHAVGTRYEEMKNIFSRLMNGAVQFQKENGLWDTILDHPDYAYDETSGSALLGYAMLRGVRLGHLPERFRDYGIKVFEGLDKKLKKTKLGYSVCGVSSYTNAVSKKRYKKVKRKCDITWGVGAYLLLASEINYL